MSDQRQLSFAKQQHILADEGLARGQCGECGAYRTDGKAPALHHDGCSHEDDWRVDPFTVLDLPGVTS